jgi:murein DD-endopeptidase MepM/ murein hydrolase activator NlpD
MVYAAREGTVVAVAQDSDVGGPDKKYIGAANFVVIAHDDGTFAEYLHLKKDGALVKLGQKVKQHEAIALSGNTGMTSRPHLHFAVFCVRDGTTRTTLPLQFRTKSGEVETLKQGRVY